MESLNDADVQLARLKKRLDREQRARAESEAIAEKALSELYTKKKEIELLQLITVAANEASTVDGAMRIALDRVCAHTRWPVGHVHLKDSAGGSYRPVCGISMILNDTKRSAKSARP